MAIDFKFIIWHTQLVLCNIEPEEYSGQHRITYSLAFINVDKKNVIVQSLPRVLSASYK